jgi:ABC-type nitrate/sulfonate/bicarbonate transport system substrate-binding protein
MITSRNTLPTAFGVFALAVSACLLAAPTAYAQAPSVWPVPYERISQKSIDWLKAKQWWPLTLAWQPPFAGQNATIISMVSNNLLQQRGLEYKLLAAPSGVVVNKAITEGAAQFGAGGNFPLTLLIDQGVPIRVIAITAPNLKHQVIVSNASPIQKMADFRGANPPAQFGLVQGSSAEFYFQAAAAANRLRLGKDFVIKNLPQAEQIKLPSELAGVVPWDSTATLITSELKTGRAIDVSYPYNVYQGSFFVRKELVEAVPDVVKALTEALVEADLLIRLNPDRAADAMAAREEMKAFPRSLLLKQINEYNLLYKPSYMYPLGAFWGAQNQDVAMWLHLQGKLKKPLKTADYEAVFYDKPMQEVFAQLGWKVPLVPPYIPSNWTLKAKTSSRLPTYATYLNMSGAQPWPERSDLVKPFTFNRKVYTPGR